MKEITENYSSEEIKHDILKMYASAEYQKLNTYYRQDNIFSIIGKSRDENVHSNFLAWLLDSNSNHGLGTKPIELFLRVIDFAKTKMLNRKAYLPENFDEYISNINKIEYLKSEREIYLKNKRRPDIKIEIKFNSRQKN